jgi:hypothetical protein
MNSDSFRHGQHDDSYDFQFNQSFDNSGHQTYENPALSYNYNQGNSFSEGHFSQERGSPGVSLPGWRSVHGLDGRTASRGGYENINSKGTRPKGYPELSKILNVGFDNYRRSDKSAQVDTETQESIKALHSQSVHL